jgi:hypothetical protein
MPALCVLHSLRVSHPVRRRQLRMYYTVSRHSVVVGLPARRRARHKSRTLFYNCMTRRRIIL